MAERKFDKAELLEVDLPWSALEDEIVENSRWSIHHKIIFEYEGKYYQTYYSVGATESQDESPWEYDDKVKCVEVEKKQVMVEQWAPVEDQRIGGRELKYRKKPVEIEAFQYDGELKGKDGYYVPNWAVKAFEAGNMFYSSLGGDPCELFVKTLEGNHHVSVGDFVIQGVQGELYPCKPDIFEMTYEKC